MAAVPNINKVADRGQRNSATGTGAAVVTLTNPTSILPGNWLIARVGVDNSGASGAAPGLTMSDSRSHTWTVGTAANNDPGAASAGITAYLVYVKVTTAFQAGDTVTFTAGTGTPTWAIVIEEWNGIHNTPVAVAQTTATSTTTTVTISRTPTVIGQLMYAMTAIEGQSADFGTLDADSTGGTWTGLTKDQGNSGTPATSVAVYGGFKVVTSTAAQTWDNTLVNTRDSASVAIVFAFTPTNLQSVSGGMTPAGAVTKLTNKRPSGAMTPAGAVTKLTNKLPTGGGTPAGVLRPRLTNKLLAGSATPAGAPAKAMSRRLVGHS